MRANDVHGANLHYVAASAADLKFLSRKLVSGTSNRKAAQGCYKATVNESETINKAQPLCLVRGRRETSGLGASGVTFPVVPLVERS
jgi:hypothetical protein